MWCSNKVQSYNKCHNIICVILHICCVCFVVFQIKSNFKIFLFHKNSFSSSAYYHNPKEEEKSLLFENRIILQFASSSEVTPEYRSMLLIFLSICSGNAMHISISKYDIAQDIPSKGPFRMDRDIQSKIQNFETHLLS